VSDFAVKLSVVVTSR